MFVGIIYSVSIGPFWEYPWWFGKFCSEQVKQGWCRYQSQKRQVMFQPVRSGDGDNPVGVQQPVAEENNESFLPDQEIIAALCDRVWERRETQISKTPQDHCLHPVMAKDSDCLS